MTRIQAQIAAERLLGKNAVIVRGGPNRRGLWTAYRVFSPTDSSLYGRGNSFAAALADAAKRVSLTK